MSYFKSKKIWWNETDIKKQLIVVFLTFKDTIFFTTVFI